MAGGKGGVNPNRFTVNQDVLQSSTTKTADATGEFTRNSGTARAIEIWVNITATSGTGQTLDVVVETSLDGTNFKEQRRISGINAVGAFTTVVNRADHALGKSIRVKFVIAGTTPSFTFTVDMARME